MQVHDRIVPVDLRPADRPTITGYQGDGAGVDVLLYARQCAAIACTVGQLQVAELGELHAAGGGNVEGELTAWAADVEIIIIVELDASAIAIDREDDPVLVPADVFPIDLTTAHVRGLRRSAG